MNKLCDVIFIGMKTFYAFLGLVLLFAACQQSASRESTQSPASQNVENTVPPVGTIILADSMRIPDALNKFYFSVQLVADEYTRQGTYDVMVHYGPADATTQITFPKGGTKKIIPKMKKGKSAFTYIIGFNYGEDDPTFYEYYEVKGSLGQIEMNYLKAYSFK